MTVWLAFKYAWRELRAGLKGFYIFLACLILGVAVIAGVQSLSLGLYQTLKSNGRFILGGDIALQTIYQPATRDQITYLRKNAGIVAEVMETRAMARHEEAGKAALVEIKAVDPFYPLSGQIEMEDGAGHQLTKGIQDYLLPELDENAEMIGIPGALVEKELLSRLDLNVGDMLRLGTLDFEIRGILTRESDRISVRGFSFAPRVMISHFIIDKTGLTGKGAQVYYDYRVLMPHARTPQAMKKVVETIQAAWPDARWNIRTSFRASPRMERWIDRLTLFLTLTGLTALLVGGVGVSNAVRSFLDTKRHHIATLKCLGASGSFIVQVYTLMILMLTALGIAGGLMLGAIGAKWAGTYVADQFDLTNFVGIYPDSLILAGMFGLLTSLCFSVWPLARGAEARPADLFRDLIVPHGMTAKLQPTLWIIIFVQLLIVLTWHAMSHALLAVWFIFGSLLAFGVFAFYAMLVKWIAPRIPFRLPTEWRLAFANISRPGNVTTGVTLSLGLGLTVLVMIGSVEHNFLRALSTTLHEDTPTFFFLDIKSRDKDDFVKMIDSYPSARKLVLAPYFRGRIVAVNGTPAEDALSNPDQSWVVESDRGFTWQREKPENGDIIAGEWWPEDYTGVPIVSIAHNIADAFGIGPGDTLTVSVYGFDVTAEVANVRRIDWGTFTMNFSVTFSPGSLLEKAPTTYLGTVVTQQADEEAIQNNLAMQFPGLTIVRVRDALASAQNIMKNVALAIRASAGVTLLVGMFVLAGGIAAARRRHVYDAVILKVLGATQGRILRTFLYEYGLLGLFTVLIAAGLEHWRPGV